MSSAWKGPARPPHARGGPPPRHRELRERRGGPGVAERLGDLREPERLGHDVGVAQVGAVELARPEALAGLAGEEVLGARPAGVGVAQAVEYLGDRDGRVGPALAEGGVVARVGARQEPASLSSIAEDILCQLGR